MRSVYRNAGLQIRITGQTDDGNKNSREDESVVEHRVRANGNPLTTLKISLLWYPFAL